MGQRQWCIIKIIVSLLVVIVCGGVYIFFLTRMITQDTAYTGNNSITIKRDDIVSKVLHNINSEQIEEAFFLIEQLKNDDNINNEIKTYFSNFEKFYRTINNGYTNLNTSIFIKNSTALENYFGTNSKDEQAIVPYFCIKHYNAKNKKQEKEVAIYKDYIDRFVEGSVSLNKEGANIICLYIYASYAKTEKDFVPLKDEIARYFVIYKNNLGDNGDLNIQRKYLLDFQENLRQNPDFKREFWSWNTVIHPFETGKKYFNGKKKMEPYPIQYL